mmetsp:Transcript_48011/g.133964  ORF Transcript_48011/g.133964 Transcript_48011/m.133964 type:complete len:246 (-) Transcript_48011:888-1625(-)
MADHPPHRQPAHRLPHHPCVCGKVLEHVLYLGVGEPENLAKVERVAMHRLPHTSRHDAVGSPAAALHDEMPADEHEPALHEAKHPVFAENFPRRVQHTLHHQGQPDQARRRHAPDPADVLDPWGIHPAHELALQHRRHLGNHRVRAPMHLHLVKLEEVVADSARQRFWDPVLPAYVIADVHCLLVLLEAGADKSDELHGCRNHKAPSYGRDGDGDHRNETLEGVRARGNYVAIAYARRGDEGPIQ